MPRLRVAEGLFVGGKQFVALEQRSNLENLDAEAGDDAARILVHDVPGRARQLDPVAMHHERDRRAVNRGGVQTVERLSRDPPRITGVADHMRAIAMMGLEAEREAGPDGEHDAQAAGAQLGATWHPRDVPGDIEAAAELLDHARAIEEAERGKRGVVA